MLVTIIADASWCPKTQVGGWGVWIISTRGKLIKGGEFKEKKKSAAISELCAIANGLHLALLEKIAKPKDIIVLQSDCIQIIDWLNGKPAEIPRAVWRPLEYIGRLVIKYELILKPRHVKGHTGGEEPRLWVNNFVDRLARRHMRRRRDKK